MDNLLELERHKPNRMGGRAGAPFLRTHGVRDVVLEICARDVPTIPARWEYDMHENAFVAVALWERVCHWVGWLVVVHAIVADGLVRGSRARRPSVGRAGDHAQTLGELSNVGFGATMKVVDAPH